jgi:mono/diheme cytochrome c family protein
MTATITEDPREEKRMPSTETPATTVRSSDARRTRITRWEMKGMLAAGATLAFATWISTAEMAFAGPPSGAAKRSSAASAKSIKKGQALYTKNCMTCHGANAIGGEGPDLHGLKLTDKQIIATIKTGNDQMPAFAKKFNTADMQALVAYLRSLKK